MIGFTGTQKGMTPEQYRYVWQFLNGLDPDVERWYHHGDCIGADHDFHRLVRRLPHYLAGVHLHPPVIDTKRAFCDYDAIENPLPYIERNHNIVDASKLLIATPGEAHEVQRSGTWATIRYAMKTNTKRLVVDPDGLLNLEWTNCMKAKDIP